MNATADSSKDNKQDTKPGANPAPGTSDGNTAVPHQGDHDRVQMLTLNPDGTPRQHNPEIIGDPEVAKELAREQFKQQAISAYDSSTTSVPMMVVGDEMRPASEAPQDPAIQKAVDDHAEIAKAAEKAADVMVDSLSARSDENSKG